MAIREHNGKRYNFDILDNLTETVSNLNKSVEILRDINQDVSDSASTLRKQSDTLRIKKTHEITTVEFADSIRARIEQFIEPTILSITDQFEVNLNTIDDEIAALTEKVQSQRTKLSLLDSSSRMEVDEETEEDNEVEENRMRRKNEQLKLDLLQLNDDIAHLSMNSEDLSKEIKISNEKRKNIKPSLSKIMERKLDLIEERRKLIDLENEWKQKVQQKRSNVDTEMTDHHDETAYAAQYHSTSSHDNTENKYEYIQNILLQINDPSFLASKSNSAECVKQARLFKETLPKEDHHIHIDTSNPQAVEAWLKKKSHNLGSGLILDAKLQKTTARVVELLMSKTIVSLDDFQKEYPIDEEEDHGLSKILNLLAEAGTIRLEGKDILLKL